MCSGQVLPPTSCGPAGSPPSPRSALVSHWPHINLDFATGLPPSNGHTVVLTVMDMFAKAVHFIADLVSDSGPQFISQVWKAFCRALGASVNLSSGYHPQTNGQAERANQDLGTTLRCVPSAWSEHLSWIEYAHNSMCSNSQCSYWHVPFQVFPGLSAALVSHSGVRHLCSLCSAPSLPLPQGQHVH